MSSAVGCGRVVPAIVARDLGHLESWGGIAGNFEE